MPEYLESRCPACQNINRNRSTCPDTLHKPLPMEQPCKFVKDYKDAEGLRYLAVGDPDSNSFMIKCQYNPQRLAKIAQKLPVKLRHKVFNRYDSAQSALNIYAKSQGWEEA